MAQSFEDETNTQKVIDPSYAWIIPTGADKPIKIGFEGGAAVREWENKDWSREIQVYKKVGVVAMMSNNICAYRDMSLASMTEWNLLDTVKNVVVVEQSNNEDANGEGEDEQNPSDGE